MGLQAGSCDGQDYVEAIRDPCVAGGNYQQKDKTAQIGREGVTIRFVKLGFNFAAALKQPHHNGLAPIVLPNFHAKSAVFVHETGFATDESFVHFGRFFV
ncbi:MAG: hypothetical protein ABSG52_16590 [Terriglobales bacterium]